MSPMPPKTRRNAPELKPRFEEKDTVICHDTGHRGTGKHYYCNVQQVRLNEEKGEYEYFIHWKGWATKFDEWILDSDERLSAKTDDAVRLLQEERLEKEAQKSLKRTKRDGSSANSRSSTPATESQAGDAKKRRRSGVPDTVESAQEHARRPEVKINLPALLKETLVDDYAQINGQQLMLAKLPARRTVRDIVEDYITDRSADKTKSEQQRSILCENSRGIRTYFDHTLGSQLLYKFERVQYENYLSDKTRAGAGSSSSTADLATATSDEANEPPAFVPSEHYGYVHLCRLFCRFGIMLAYTPFNKNNTQRILKSVDDFLEFLVKNREKYWNVDRDYETTTLEYQKRVYEM